jgi:hypothetical protein
MISTPRQFMKAVARRDPVILVNLGAPHIRDPTKRISRFLPLAEHHGYEYVGMQQAVVMVGASILMAEFRRRPQPPPPPPSPGPPSKAPPPPPPPPP